MLQSIRNNSQGVVAYFILGIMVLAMAAFGVGPLLDSIGGRPEAADVNGEEISEQAVLIEVERQKQQLYMSGVSDISDDLLREQVLTRLISANLFEQAADSLDLDVSQTVINQQIINNPAFSNLNGYDPQSFQLAIRQQGYTPETFARALTDDYVLQQYISGVTGTAFSTEQELAALLSVADQKRSFEYGIISTDMFSDQEIEEALIQERYDTSSQRFLTPATMTVNYVDLDKTKLVESVEVTEEQLRQELLVMRANAERMSTKRVAHILVTPKDDGSEQQTIEAIEVGFAAGEDFGELAAEYSDDFASAEYDGEIGETSGESFDPAIEDAVADMSPGDISGPISTPFGQHFVKVISEDKGEDIRLEDVKEELAARVKNLEVERLYAAKVEELRDAAYQYGDIETLATALGYTIKTTEEFTQGAGDGVMQSAELRDVAFSPEVRVDGVISDLIELNDGEAVIVALNSYEPSRVQSFDEVHDLLEIELLQELATSQALTLGQNIVADAQTGKNLSDLLAAENLTWLVASEVPRTTGTVDAMVLSKAFELATPKASDKAFYAEPLEDGRVAVIGLKPSVDGLISDSPPEQIEQMLGFLENLNEAAQMQALQIMLETESTIERN